jgi:dihydrolipoamide dehydrogenase
VEHYQVAVIGGGPGGYVAAVRAAQHGLKTVLIEKDRIGGTCLNIGCIPTKSLIKDAEILHEIRHAEARGIRVGQPAVDMPALMAGIEKVISQLSSGVSAVLTANGVDVRMGEALVTDAHALTVRGAGPLGFDNLIVATGSSNVIPPVPGLSEQGILTSTEALRLREIPASIAILGGGVIGCEMATIFAQFGSHVTIIEMMPQLLPNMDTDVSRELKRRLGAMGVTAMNARRVTAVERDSGHWNIRTDAKDEKPLSVGAVMVCVGRRGNLAGLEPLGLQTEKGYIKTNEQMQTNVPGVYAIGDITGTIQLAHVASAQGITAADHIAGRPAAMRYGAVPSCIYTIPEIGAVGLTEAAARAAYGDEILVGRFPMAACGKALAMGSAHGFTKLIAEKQSGRLLGCHIIGPSATEIIGEAVSALHFGGTLRDISHTIHAHPTVSETVMEAAHLMLGEPIHMPPAKKRPSGGAPPGI